MTACRFQFSSILLLRSMSHHGIFQVGVLVVAAALFGGRGEFLRLRQPRNRERDKNRKAWRRLKVHARKFPPRPSVSCIRRGCLHAFFAPHPTLSVLDFIKYNYCFFDHCFRVIQSENGYLFLSKPSRALPKIISVPRLALSHGAIGPWWQRERAAIAPQYNYKIVSNWK